MAAEVDRAVAAASKVIAAVYIIPTAGKAVKNNGAEAANSVALAGTPSAVLQSLLEKAHEKTVVVAMGSPYIAADYPQIENYLCAYSHVTVSETAVVRALFGEIPIQGHLPVTIPGFAERGTGIQRPAM
jgi:beta-N-acetylhexosaminidase